MGQDLIRSDALSWVNFKHLLEQVHCLGVHLFVDDAIEIESHFSIIFIDLFKFASLKKGFFDK
jgi:hypothetical protein